MDQKKKNVIKKFINHRQKTIVYFDTIFYKIGTYIINIILR